MPSTTLSKSDLLTLKKTIISKVTGYISSKHAEKSLIISASTKDDLINKCSEIYCHIIVGKTKQNDKTTAEAIENILSNTAEEYRSLLVNFSYTNKCNVSKSLLYLAVMNTKVSTVELLKNYGAEDPNHTLFQSILNFNHIGAYKAALIKTLADESTLKFQDSNSNTFLHLALSNQNNIESEIVLSLIQAIAEEQNSSEILNITNAEGNTSQTLVENLLKNAKENEQQDLNKILEHLKKAAPPKSSRAPSPQPGLNEGIRITSTQQNQQQLPTQTYKAKEQDKTKITTESQTSKTSTSLNNISNANAPKKNQATEPQTSKTSTSLNNISNANAPKKNQATEPQTSKTSTSLNNTSNANAHNKSQATEPQTSKTSTSLNNISNANAPKKNQATEPQTSKTSTSLNNISNANAPKKNQATEPQTSKTSTSLNNISNANAPKKNQAAEPQTSKTSTSLNNISNANAPKKNQAAEPQTSKTSTSLNNISNANAPKKNQAAEPQTSKTSTSLNNISNANAPKKNQAAEPQTSKTSTSLNNISNANAPKKNQAAEPQTSKTSTSLNNISNANAPKKNQAADSSSKSFMKNLAISLLIISAGLLGLYIVGSLLAPRFVQQVLNQAIKSVKFAENSISNTFSWVTNEHNKQRSFSNYIQK
ncbi:hypothetical protein [Rickettsiales endosymbiont of Stachyamoeba lipophora]|uniref:hypothetical protein n=1 Tax=Rickettsiales endosymbiont of Stachyamoeba lipophora TaxID=2486578 RepID=UPI000F650B02|nr:hypothetical protein [Rickettsiales endosymbiont of Stachyamoeba lipophora]AZL16063.1 hypothetical protein EF513_05885 [Rickettsiales endosymbiont of Stachyamoeba lipophora]